MKKWFLFLCASSILCSAPIDGSVDESEPLPVTEIPLQEIAAFDPNSIAQTPIAPQELQLPTPTLDLPRHKSVFLAVGLSTLIPGLGHVYLGDAKTAGGLFGSTGVGVGVAAFPEIKGSIRLSSFITVQNTWAYGIYAAYRDVRLYNADAGYSYKMPTDSLADLTFAPFRPSILKKPEVWGGFLGAFALAIGTSYLIHPKEMHIQPVLSSTSKTNVSPLLALPIGIGEESLFRGYLQSSLSEILSPWGGIIVSSLAFGAVHIPNALLLEPEDRQDYYTINLPLITGFGLYLGWLTHKNHSLKESVALHTWYDLVALTAGVLASRAAITGRSEFAIAIPF